MRATKPIPMMRRRRLKMPMSEAAGGGGSPPAPPPSSSAASPTPAGGDTWYSGYADDVKSYVERNRFPDAGEALKAGMNAEKMIGAPASDIVRRPTQGYDVDPKPHMDALRVLGAPSEAKAYGEAGVFKPVEGLGELKADVQTSVSTKFQELGILPWQAQALLGMYGDLAKAEKAAAGASETEAAQARTAALDAFKAERGGAFAQDVARASAAIKAFDVKLKDDPGGRGELEAWLEDTKAGDDPRFIRFFGRLQERLGGSGLPGDPGRTGSDGAMTKTQAQQRYDTLHRDAGWKSAFTDSGHPGHKEAVAENLRLLETIHG
jgi:hypothetical protein